MTTATTVETVGSVVTAASVVSEKPKIDTRRLQLAAVFMPGRQIGGQVDMSSDYDIRGWALFGPTAETAMSVRLDDGRLFSRLFAPVESVCWFASKTGRVGAVAPFADLRIRCAKCAAPGPVELGWELLRKGKCPCGGWFIRQPHRPRIGAEVWQELFAFYNACLDGKADVEQDGFVPHTWGVFDSATAPAGDVPAHPQARAYAAAFAAAGETVRQLGVVGTPKRLIRAVGPAHPVIGWIPTDHVVGTKPPGSVRYQSPADRGPNQFRPRGR